MNSWQLILNLAYPKYAIGQIKFTSYGDWSCEVRQIPKTNIEGPRQVLKAIMKKYRFYEQQQFSRMAFPKVRSFEQGLKCCNVRITNDQGLRQYYQGYDISEILFCQVLYSDGNKTIGVMEDTSYYYCISYFTS